MVKKTVLINGRRVPLDQFKNSVEKKSEDSEVRVGLTVGQEEVTPTTPKAKPKTKKQKDAEAASKL